MITEAGNKFGNNNKHKKYILFELKGELEKYIEKCKQLQLNNL